MFNKLLSLANSAAQPKADYSLWTNLLLSTNGVRSEEDSNILDLSSFNLETFFSMMMPVKACPGKSLKGQLQIN